MYSRLRDFQNLDSFSTFRFKFYPNKTWFSPKTMLTWTLNQRLIIANKIWWPQKTLTIMSWRLSLMSYLDVRFSTDLEPFGNHMLARYHTNFQEWKLSSFYLCRTKNRTKKTLGSICVRVFWSYVLISATTVILAGKNANIFLFWEGRGGWRGAVAWLNWSYIFSSFPI